MSFRRYILRNMSIKNFINSFDINHLQIKAQIFKSIVLFLFCLLLQNFIIYSKMFLLEVIHYENNTLLKVKKLGMKYIAFHKLLLRNYIKVGILFNLHSMSITHFWPVVITISLSQSTAGHRHFQ